MELRNEESGTTSIPIEAQQPEGRKPRFQVIKVEDSIAPGHHDEASPSRGQGCSRHCRCRCGR